MTTQQPTNPLENIIDAVDAAIQAERNAHNAEVNRCNTERLEKAESALDKILGDTHVMLAPFIEARTEYDNNGLVVIHTWMIIAGDAHQLAPIKLTWRRGGYIYGEPHDYITAFIENGAKGKSWSNHLTPGDLPAILYAARQAYPVYKAAQEAEAKLELQEKISRLSLTSLWNYTKTLAEVTEVYHKLSELDAEHAKCLFAEWKTSRIKYLIQGYYWSANHHEDEIMPRYNELRELNPETADRLLENWREARAARQAEEARKAAADAAYNAAYAEYERQYQEWQEQCRQWAASEQARLWKPWVAWKVRYAPLDIQYACQDGSGEDDIPDLLTEVYTLTPPDEIVRQRPVSRIRKIDHYGVITENFAIACFLDAEPVLFEEPKSHYHRTVWAGGHCIYIPPFLVEEPAPAPAEPQAPKRQGHNDEVPF